MACHPGMLCSLCSLKLQLLDAFEAHVGVSGEEIGDWHKLRNVDEIAMSELGKLVLHPLRTHV